MLTTQTKDTERSFTQTAETLSIPFHTDRLILRALEKYPDSMNEAAAALGISLRNLQLHKKRLLGDNIKRNTRK